MSVRMLTSRRAPSFAPPSGQIWSTGYAFVAGAPDALLLDGAIGAHLARAGDVARAASRLDGSFAAIVERDDATLLVTDRYGSVPLYYREPLTRPAVASSDPWAVVATLSRRPTLDAVGVVDMLRTGYTVGAHTLIEHVHTVPPATVIRVSGTRASAEQYWHLGYEDGREAPSRYERRLDALLDTVAARIDAFCIDRGRDAVLMLSGGVDTRFLAALLATRCRTRTRVMSYGAADDPDVRTARQVADVLGFRYERAPITVDGFTDWFTDRSAFAEAIDEVGITTRFTCGTGARFVALPADGVVLTGHTGFLSSQVVPLNWGPNDVAGVRRMTYARHYTYGRSETLVPRSLRLDYRALRHVSIDETLAGFDADADSVGQMHRWNEEQRQRNLVFMEYRVYERRAGWMMPLAGHDLVDLFLGAPSSIRIDQVLYKNMLRRMCTGRAEPLSKIGRVGGCMEVSDREFRRFEMVRRSQPVSGAVLTRLLPLVKRFSGRQRRTPPLQHGPTPLRHWFLTDGRFRDAVLERLDEITVDLLRAEGVRAAVLDARSGEWVFQHLLAGALTVQGTADHAARVWSDQTSEPTGRPSTI